MNAQGKCGSTAGIQAVLSMVSDLEPQWSVLFIAEADYLASWNVDFDISPHRSWRHWDGPGSRALRFVLHRKFAHLFKSCRWDGRCGMLSLCSGLSCANTSKSIDFVGIHGAHGDQFVDSLASASNLLGLRASGSKCLLFGDFNCDQLPALPSDPFSHLPGRSQHHANRRQIL